MCGHSYLKKRGRSGKEGRENNSTQPAAWNTASIHVNTIHDTAKIKYSVVNSRVVYVAVDVSWKCLNPVTIRSMRAVRAVLCLALLTQCGYHSAATDTERSRPIRLRRCNNGGKDHMTDSCCYLSSKRTFMCERLSLRSIVACTS